MPGKKPHANTAAARARGEQPVRVYTDTTGATWDLSWDDKCILIYDNMDRAEQLALEFGTYAKHSNNRFAGTWKTFSLVRLPET